MSDNEKRNPTVTDRRRFDSEGNPREPQQASADVAAEQRGGGDEGASASRQQRDMEAEFEEQAPPPPGKAPERSREEIAKLESDLEAARRRVDELARAYQALDRDREEFKQRLNRERERTMDVERGKVALGLLDAIDELDRALSSTPADNSPLAQGVRLIRDNLLRRAQDLGIERVELQGKPFDPNVAEAVDIEMTAEKSEDQKVVDVIRPAYRIKDNVIRPGRVKVAKYVKPAEA